MLTHDFEPIIDFGVVGKLPEDALNSKFIKNNQGILTEKAIDYKQDIKPVVMVPPEQILFNNSVALVVLLLSAIVSPPFVYEAALVMNKFKKCNANAKNRTIAVRYAHQLKLLKRFFKDSFASLMA